MDHQGHSMTVVRTIDNAMVGLIPKPESSALRDSPGFTPDTRPRLYHSRRRQSLSARDRRPLRSSPLAGPVFSNHLSVEPEAEHDIKESEGLDACASTSLSFANLQQLPSLPKKTLFRLSTSMSPPHRLSEFPSKSKLSQKCRSFRKPSNPHDTESSADPLPPIPSWTLPEPTPSLTRGTDSSATHEDGPSRTDCTPPVERPSPSETIRSSAIHANRASTCLEPLENWMTVNTYEITPRFSRLGISASTVVLPVSARQYRRASRRTSPSPVASSSLPSSPVSCGPHPVAKHLSHSLQSLALTAYNINSASSSRETLAISLPCSSAPSIVSSSDIGTVFEDSEETDLGSSSTGTDDTPVLKASSTSELHLGRHTISFHLPFRHYERQDIDLSPNSTSSSCLKLEMALQQELVVARPEDARLIHDLYLKNLGKFKRLWKKISSIGRRST